MTFLQKNGRPLIYALLLIMFSAGAVGALTIKGIDFADQVTISEKKLYLNGVGIKKSFFSTLYACGLYLPHPTYDADKAIKNDLCKQIVMHFQSKLSKDKIIEGWNDGFFNNSQEKLYILQGRITTFNALFRDMAANDRITFSYVPKQGTTITINNETKGTIPGSDFMQALWAIWLGDNPADSDMKKGMLGK
ncbi:MAG: chalcone isomerase family protein [Deltaproteobacteria bacterium]|nr:chalcone isomerase family protein [Candidatus Tharpella aukensis]